jgi:hypothetical protein
MRRQFYLLALHILRPIGEESIMQKFYALIDASTKRIDQAANKWVSVRPRKEYLFADLP